MQNFEVFKWIFSIAIIAWCFSNIFIGLKDISQIDDIMRSKKHKKQI